MRETEEDFLTWVLALAKLRRWRVSHFRPARTEKGWRTPVQGDKGFVDVVLARNGRVLLVELKSDTGRLTPEQREWRSELGDAYRLWRPCMRREIEEELK